MQIGVMLNNLEPDRLRAFAVAKSHCFDLVHTSAIPEAWLTNGVKRQAYIDAARDSGVTIECMFVGYDGQSYSDIPTIARTVGLWIPHLRRHRLDITKRYSDLAAELGVSALATHLGFLREGDLEHKLEFAKVVREAVEYAASNGQTFRLETGQDSAALLLGFMRLVDHPALGVNFDPGNFVLYGSDNPLHACDTLAPHIHGVHCKDAIPSTHPDTLGTEMSLGDGVVPFPALLERLHGSAYPGSLVIERETVNAAPDILRGREYLRRLLSMFRAEH